ncbi:MAG: protein-disulfide reductase DsbD domain-containing protein, partial [Myxococcota bacterium]
MSREINRPAPQVQRRARLADPMFFKGVTPSPPNGTTLLMLTFALLIAAAASQDGPPPEAPVVPPSAVGETAYEDGRARVRAYLVTDVERVTAGETLRAGILYQLDPGWHIYWSNPGDAAIPTDLSLETLQGTVGDFEWPFPSVFRESNGFITTFGYAREALLFAPVHVDDDSGVLELSARSDFLACKVEC